MRAPCSVVGYPLMSDDIIEGARTVGLGHHKPQPGQARLESSLRILGGVVLGVAAWLLPQGVRADAPLFVWADARAHVHVTDRLSDVPEPYHSVYAARVAELKKAGKGTGGPGSVTVVPAEAAFAVPRVGDASGSGADRVANLSPLATEQANRRSEWRGRIAQARGELTQATEQLADLEKTIAEAGMNPILRLTPQVQAKLASLEQEHAQAQSRVLDSRRMLLETLPQQAKREHVPAQWLQ